MEGPIVNFLYENIDVFSTLGLLIVFAISFLESTPFFGLIVPTQTILVIGGFLTKISGSSFGDIFLIAVAGSIAGDIASFYAGRKFGPDILTKYGSKFLIKKEYVEKTGALLDEHLGKTLFIGRLSAIPRSIAPFLAGSSGINFFRFLAWVTAGAVLWSLVFIGAGFVFAQSYDVLGPAIGKFIYSAIAIAIFMLAVLVYFRKKHFFITSRHIALIITSVLSLFTFSIIGQNVLEHGQIKEIDTLLHPMISGLQNTSLTPVMLFFTQLGDEVAMTLITLCIAMLFYLKKKKSQALLLCFSMFVGAISVYLIKASVGSTRPLLGVITETSHSFPSGHATLSMIFALSLAYICVKRECRETHIWCVLLGSLLFPAVIGFSRLYLGVHWFSDVLAGFMLGIFVTTVSILLFDFVPWLYRKIKTRQITPNL